MYRDMQRAMHACGAELPGCDVAPERLDDEKPMNETKIDEKRDNEVNEKHADEMMPTETQACRERLRNVPCTYTEVVHSKPPDRDVRPCLLQQPSPFESGEEQVNADHELCVVDGVQART